MSGLLENIWEDAERTKRRPADDARSQPVSAQEEYRVRAIGVPYSQIEREVVDWLWPGRIPRRAVTLLVGDPGLGKSLMTDGIAAHLSREGGVTLMATAEDSPETTVRPRLEAAGAVLEHVHDVRLWRDDLEDGLRLPDDVDALERLVEEREAQLVVIDPLVAYLPAEVNSWRDQSVRWALAPLRLLAQRQDCAVLAVVHLNKAFSTDALKRIGGSVGIGAAARSVLLLARDPEDPDGDSGSQRVLAHVKSNLSELASSLSYVIDPVLIPALNSFPEVRTAKIAGTGESVHSGQDLLAGRDDEEQGALAEAIEFLRLELVEGKRPAKAVKLAAKDAGVSEKTLSRAAKRLGVKKEKDGFQGTWLWGLSKDGQQDWPPLNDGQDGHLCGNPHETGDLGPLRESETAKDGQLSNMATFDGMGGFSFLPGLA